ncbi:RNA polymerase sigma factor [Candidatus Cryosericum odellii]|jgi:RNA polymerase sigma-70 factor (ECF subfamily)|uniref:RNA polymerase sigma factor n=2 Tax=Candidatus Cryosericum odellii TaxID=2290917 RepID=A0A398DE37_9BACT|nr:RNA polymerase sigma factor [Candidatus Cryosericum odellii]RIE13752.1 RNA polymerase sigma factor [Candidatus Cryosericum odellii]
MFNVGWYPTPPGVYLNPIRITGICNETIVNVWHVVATRSYGVAEQSEGRTGACLPPLRNVACTEPDIPWYHTCMEMRAQEPTDEQLVRQALTDTDAFGMLVERYERPLSSYAARLIGRQEAEDVVQQAFLQAYRSLAGFDPRLTFSAWMYRIVHNTAVNMARKRHGTVPTELELDGEMVEILTGDTDVPAEALHRELEDFVAKGLNQLDQRSRDILLLSVVEGKSYSEIADILMVAVNSVGPSVSRAKNKLRKLLDANPAQRSAL